MSTDPTTRTEVRSLATLAATVAATAARASRFQVADWSHSETSVTFRPAATRKVG